MTNTSHFHQDHEAPILWPPDVNSQLIGKDPDAGKDRGQESMDMNFSKLQEIVKDREAQVVISK